ncbi:MAG: hypothetical protein E7066_09235 [Lentimicrobiaceae bacterium]|nr:hypothetical protein [Lentimicrobiaceae bacterium]
MTDSINNGCFWLTSNHCYLKDAQAVLAIESSNEFKEQNLSNISIGKYTVAPWGADNVLPQRVLGKMDQAEIVGSNANFNWQVAFGLGPKLVKLVRDVNNNRIVDYWELDKGKEFDWFEQNDIPLFMMETLTDLSYFANAFPVLVFDKSFKNIQGVRHREATFSRWAVNAKTGEIEKMLYSSKWGTYSVDDITAYNVIDEYNAIADLKYYKYQKEKTVCYPVYMPSPGRPYYSYPSWYSIFRSGWFDQIASIPSLKKAIIKHQLGVKFIIYISPRFFEAQEKLNGVAEEDLKARKELRDKLVSQINATLAGEENAGKTIVATKEMIPAGNGASEEKMISIETIKSDISSEYLDDYETGANVISYAMGVHPSLVGAVPGKNSNSLSGSNIREIFLMKQALTFPMIDRAMRIFSVVRKFNGWDKDVRVVVPEYIFTTLDQNKSGKQESTNAISK